LKNLDPKKQKKANASDFIFAGFHRFSLAYGYLRPGSTEWAPR
jgi:hypothetical protein